MHLHALFALIAMNQIAAYPNLAIRQGTYCALEGTACQSAGDQTSQDQCCGTGGFVVCADGSFVYQECGIDTTCTGSGDTLACSD